MLLSITGYYAWTMLRPPGEPGEGSMAPTRVASGLPPERLAPSRAPSTGEPVPPLQLEGLTVVDAPDVSDLVVTEAVEIPDLPELTPSSVTPALLAWAADLARKNPGVDELRDYVIAAHFVAAGRETRAGRYREALRLLDACEDWGPPAGDVASFRAAIHGAQEEWEPALKWAQLAVASGSRANPAEMHHIIGKVHYYREEMPKAIQAFRTALDIRDDPEIRTSLDRALREASSSAGLRNRKLAHFIVRYEGRTMEDTGRMVIDTMDRSYATLVSQLGFEPSERVVVILYSRQHYRAMGGPHWSAGMFDGKIRVPVQGLERLDEGIRTTLHHELAHAFIHSLAGKAAPRWLHEGIAEFVEGTRTEQNGPLLADALQQGGSFEHCLSTVQCNPRLFYAASASVVDYLVQQRGLRGIRDVLAALGNGTDVDSALRKVFSRDVGALVRDWEHFVRRRYG